MLRGPSGEAEETRRQWEGCSGQWGPVLWGGCAADRNQIFWLSGFQCRPCTDGDAVVQKGGVIGPIQWRGVRDTLLG